MLYGSASGYLFAPLYQGLPFRRHLRSASNKIAMATEYSQGTTTIPMCDEWNSLPCGVREEEDFENFKEKLKISFFQKIL